MSTVSVGTRAARTVIVEVAEPSQGPEGARRSHRRSRGRARFWRACQPARRRGCSPDELVEAGRSASVRVSPCLSSANRARNSFGVEGGLGAFRAALDVAADLGEPHG